MKSKIADEHFQKLMRTKVAWESGVHLGQTRKKLFRTIELEMEHLQSSVFREVMNQLEQAGEEKAAKIVRSMWL